MQTAHGLVLTAAFAALTVAGCSTRNRPAEEPTSTTTTTGVSTNAGPGSAGDPLGLSVEPGGPTVNSAAPAEPMEGNCPSGGAPETARDLADCTKHCRGLDEAVPPGSRCLSSRVACEQQCEARFGP